LVKRFLRINDIL